MSSGSFGRLMMQCLASLVIGVVSTLTVAGPLLPGSGPRLRVTPDVVELPDTTIPSGLGHKGPILPSEVVAPKIVINIQPAGLTGGGRGPAPPRYDPLIRAAIGPDVRHLRFNYITTTGGDPVFPGLLEGIGSSLPQLSSYDATSYGPGGISNCDSPGGCPSTTAEADAPDVLRVYFVAGFDWIAADAAELAYIFSLVNKGGLLILDGSDLTGADGVRGTADDNVVFDGLDPAQPFFRAFSVTGYDPATEQFLNAVDITDRLGLLPEPRTQALLLLAGAALLTVRRRSRRGLFTGAAVA